MSENSHAVDPNKLKGPEKTALNEEAAVRALVIGNAVQLAAGALSPQFINTVIAEAVRQPVETAPQNPPAATQAYTAMPKFQRAPMSNAPSVSSEGASYDDFMAQSTSNENNEYLRAISEEPAPQPVWQKPMTSDDHAMAEDARMRIDQAHEAQNNNYDSAA